MGPKMTKEAFKLGKMSKPDYIKAMHQYHSIVFEYSELIKDTDIAKIEIIDGKVLATSRENGIVMICDPFDQRIAPIEILNFGQYEKSECDMVLRLIDDGQVVFDIGGNFGWYSLLISKSRNVDLFSFEPIPKTYSFLANNVAINDVRNVNTFNFGFSDKEQEIDFYYYPEGSGNASLAPLSDGVNVSSIKCTLRRLDDFTKEQGTRVDFTVDHETM